MNLPYGLLCVESCLTCHLRSDNFFCALSRESLAAFNQMKHATAFPEGAVIFLEGQTTRGIFMLCQGQAKLSTTARDGKTFILRIAKSRRSSRLTRNGYKQTVRFDGGDNAALPTQFRGPRGLSSVPQRPRRRLSARRPAYR